MRNNMTKTELPFWKTIPLQEMPREKWESLCDHCAKCCLQKLEDEETQEIFFTNIVCDFLDLDSCRCTHYSKRSTMVPNCVTLTPQDLIDPYWLPSTCAYRLLAEHKDLPSWHPLHHNGDTQQMVLAGHCIKGKVIPESDAGDWEHHLVDWI
jgi:uncharacterized cysteine cluster protein YcgN (CxxCxxCC family)